MVRLYTAATPNGRKVSIALEELEVPYEWQWTKLDAGDQNKPEFLAMNPNAKIPVLDDDGVIIWESGAILLYLADKHAALLPAEPAARAETLAYTFFQAAHVGPNLGRLGQQFNRPAEEQNKEMIDIFLTESLRVFGVFETILGDGRDYLARDYSIADIMAYPWLRAAHNAQADFFTPYPKVESWLERVAERPAVSKGMAVPE